MKAISALERPANSGAMERVPTSRYVVFALIAGLGFVADIGTKAWVFSISGLRAGEIYWLWTDHVGIQLSRNLGALFGIGQGKVWLFAALSSVALVAIPTWLFWFRAAKDAWLTFALGCVMAGVLGNLFDRLGLSGEELGGSVYAVRDWILWQVNDRWRWPNFNIADSMLVVGASLMVLHSLWHSPGAEAKNPA
jgi:signal peptidase II